MIRCAMTDKGPQLKGMRSPDYAEIYGDGECFVKLAPGWIPRDAVTLRQPATGDTMPLATAFELGIARRV